MSPFLSGVADYSGRKKSFLRFFTTIGALACISLYYYKVGSAPSFGTVAFMLATIGFAGGLVFYNAYLPEIASEDQYDKVSAKGFSYGYVGSVILLVINLLVITYYQFFGIADESIAIRLAFVMVGFWWLGFAQISFRRLPNNVKKPYSTEMFSKGWGELVKVWGLLKNMKNARIFLLAFFFYDASVQSILYLASSFADKVIKLSASELIAMILTLQLVAIAGAYFFARVSKVKGNKFSLILMLIIWIIVCFGAWQVQNKVQFYIIGVVVGIVMGGIQSLSRSTYSKLIPEKTKDVTSFFSFYDILEKFAIVLGTFIVGFSEQITGDIRNSALALLILFIVGLIILSKVKIIREVQVTQP
jgi:UMF1 family MFS transporter